MSTANNYTIFLLISALGVIECLRNIVVNTGVATIRGREASDGDYAEFLGIPYGQVDAKNPFGVSAFKC